MLKDSIPPMYERNCRKYEMSNKSVHSRTSMSIEYKKRPKNGPFYNVIIVQLITMSHSIDPVFNRSVKSIPFVNYQ